jgi:CheY-like chemotaxis protein
MPSGGRLLLRAFNVELGSTETKQIGGLEPGRYVVLIVSDSGVGIPAELQGKVFEPFFSTKERGKGTGLGLSTVYSIVLNHHGHLSLESEVGRGTSIKIYFPVAEVQGEPRSDLEFETLPTGNGELILMVDDEPAILEFGKEILESHGYRVVTASNGLDALELMDALKGETIALAISDINMPGMDGGALIRAIGRKGYPCKVIVSSGLLTTIDPGRSDDLSPDGYIAKPYTSRSLLTAVKKVISGSGDVMSLVSN